MPATELSPIAHHLFRATEMIRALPIAHLERERMYTWIYQLVCSALEIIVKDEHQGGADPHNDRELEASLKGDLDEFLGD